MSRAQAGAAVPGTQIAEQAARQRRRLGLALVTAAVVLLGVQGSFEWLLPYDLMALQDLRSLTGWEALRAQPLQWAWAAAGIAALALLAAAARMARPPAPALAAAAAGLVLGSARVAAGGAPQAMLLLLVVGVATLGWQSHRHGGMPLLAATALAIATWDTALSTGATLWPLCAALAGVFVFIEQRHIQVGDRRLLEALREREGLIAELDAHRESLTRLQAARTQLLASISHDLRQPLQAMRLYAEALRAHVADGVGQDLLRHHVRAADDAVDMLDQFGEFSAIEAGALRSRRETVDLRDIVRRVAAGVRALHGDAALRVREYGRAQWVTSDRSQLTRIVQNLAGNAVRHASDWHRGGGARVVLAARALRGEIAIDVLDNGPGIPGDRLADIFEPYVQLSGPGRARGGRGLGLAIVRGLAQQLGLRIAPVRSVLGRGTRFRVVVPAALRAAAPAEAQACEPSGAGWTGKMLALLDDDETPRAALSAALRSAGAHCVEAADFDTLCAKLDEEMRFPDALLFDLDLRSEIDGIEAVRRLRERWETEVPAVIITGRVGAQASALLPRRCTLLPKPVGLSDLSGALAALQTRQG